MILKIIVGGSARGPAVKSIRPINFLGAVDKRTGVVRDEGHELYKKPVGGSILVFPYGVGSSVGAYTIYSLKSNGCAPLAMVCQRADLAVASGCALADIPLVIVDREQFEGIQDGTELYLDSESGTLSGGALCEDRAPEP